MFDDERAADALAVEVALVDPQMVKHRDVIGGVVVPMVIRGDRCARLAAALRWSIAMTRKSLANSVVGLIGAEGWPHTAITERSPAGAKVKIGKPWPNSS